MKYNKYKYIYPPRPELKITTDQLYLYEKNFLAQPKLNGSNATLYIYNKNVIQKGRHNNILSSFKIPNSEILSIFNDNKWIVVNGEYMNKSKKNNNGLFNNKLVLFDILVFNNNYLLDETFNNRINLLYNIINPIDETDYLYKLSNNIYIVKTFYNNFLNLWNNITKIDMFEGLVLKQKNAKLKRGTSSKNNNLTQLKCRKPTKLYTY